MTITEIKPEHVFGTLAKGSTTICVDFQRGQYIDLSGQLVNAVQRMILNSNCKFFSVTED